MKGSGRLYFLQILRPFCFALIFVIKLLFMILLDKPFVSEFLWDTIKKNKIPVIETPEISNWISDGKAVVISEDEAAIRWSEKKEPLYTNSENAIRWIEQNKSFTSLSEKIKLFKNKVAFRSLLKDIFPDYFFLPVPAEQLCHLDVRTLPFPFIIKPAVGFFSMGVYKVERPEAWPQVLKKIEGDIRNNQNIYPQEVYSASEFIVEDVIEGEEIAIDCYVNSLQEPVILNIMKHDFSSENDVGDRLYFTSKKVIEQYLEPAIGFLRTLAKLSGLEQFPMHVELRIDQNGKVVPIEVNPMRFGGWCSSPDIAWHAFGINVYEYYFYQKKPNWESILNSMDNKVHCIIVLDNSTGIETNRIEFFDYDKVFSRFEKVWELRKIDHKKYSFFGMLFVASENENSEEIQRILHSDLKEFISMSET